MDFVYRFAWDPQKALDNLVKHRVAFEDAATVFRDPLILSMYDEAHSGTEERWITLGLAEGGTLLVVIHTFGETEDANRASVRIISARPATRAERHQYEEGTP